jgi:hypothetical protein
MILTLMIREEKGFELMKIIFITHLSTFGPKVFLTLKIMDFESVTLTKIVHMYVIKGKMHNIHDIKSICNQNVFIYKMQC